MKKEIIDFEVMLPQHKTKKWPKRNLLKITDLTVHHSDTSPGITLDMLAKIQIGDYELPGFNYHFAILQDGRIFQCNSLENIVFHNSFNNSSAIGIVFIGNFNNVNDLNIISIDSFNWLSLELKKKCPNLVNLMGHREYQGGLTTCPGYNIVKILDYLRKFNNLKYNPKGTWKFKE